MERCFVGPQERRRRALSEQGITFNSVCNPAEVPGMVTQGSPDLRRPVLLLADDQALLVAVLSVELEDYGFEVLRACSGYQALIKLSERPDVDVMITDVLMDAHMSGIALAKRVRQDHPNIRIIVMSAHMQPEEHHLPPGTLFIAKPLKASDLASAVRGLLQLPSSR